VAEPTPDAERIRALRTALRLTQRELADEWGLSPAAVARWETGDNPVPGPVRKLLEIYEGELAAPGAFVEGDASFLARGFNGIAAYGAWVFFRRTFGIAGTAASGAHDALARQFANDLSKHRGVLMKLGQRALYLEPLLSEHEREALAKLRDHAQPMSSATVHRLFRQTFGADPQALVASWDPRPARRGSIGQVYKARLADGRWVAIKVQYPGLRQSIAELDAHALDGWLTRVWTSQQGGILFDEIRERFLEECDYAAEAASIRRFRAIWRDEPRVVIPDVVDELTAGPILTTEWCDGARWEDWVEAVGGDERRRFAALAWDFYWGSLYAHGLLNADAHTGNFLFLPDRTAFIDFGCIKVVSPAFHTFFREMSKAVCEGRWRDVADLTMAQGLVVPDADLDVAPRLCVWMLLPMLVEGSFRISAGYLRGLIDALLAPMVRRSTCVSRDSLFLHQVKLASYSMLASLDVAVDYRARLIAQLYPDREPPPPLSPGALAAFGIDLDRLDAK
jgi:transcriptional regulator with XRE-family HTH domain